MALGTWRRRRRARTGNALATIAVIAGELDHDPEPASARQGATTSPSQRQQVGVQGNHHRTSRRAGVERLNAAATVLADRWLDGLRQRWHASRPRPEPALFRRSRAWRRKSSPTPPWNRRFVINLFNTPPTPPGEVTLAARWNATQLHIEAGDRGAGFPQQIHPARRRRVFLGPPLAAVSWILTCTYPNASGGSAENPADGRESRPN